MKSPFVEVWPVTVTQIAMSNVHKQLLITVEMKNQEHESIWIGLAPQTIPTLISYLQDVHRQWLAWQDFPPELMN
jgi:hypothetical protein